MDAFLETIDAGLETEFETIDNAPAHSFYDAFEEMNRKLDEGDFADEAEFLAAIDPEIAYIDAAGEVRPVIAPTALQKLCTPAGHVVIGGSLYDVEQNQTAEYAYDGDVDAALAVAPVAVTATERQVETSMVSRTDCIRETGRRRRRKGEFQVNNTAFYNELKIITKHQRRRFGTWFRSGTSRLEHDWDLEVRDENLGWGDRTDSYGKNNEAHISSHIYNNALTAIYQCNRNYRNVVTNHRAPGRGAACQNTRCR